jgi:3'(2'), 5'-bisphosphate nucleotidase
LCRTVQRDFIASVDKGVDDPVTLADYGSQAILARALAAHFPVDGVIAEEHGDQFQSGLNAELRGRVVELVSSALGSTVTEADIIAWLNHGRDVKTAQMWTIDPIDGTKGFLSGRSYTIAVGILHDGKPAAGILGSPGYYGTDGRGKLFYAVNGVAYAVQFEADAVGVALRVSARSAADHPHTVESVESKHAAHELISQIYAGAGIIAPTIIRVDGQDKYGMVASGDADLYLRISPKADYREKVWDHAAGVAVIEAAGGRVTDLYGRALDFSLGEQLANNSGVVVSNGVYHDAVLAALAKVLPPA